MRHDAELISSVPFLTSACPTFKVKNAAGLTRYPLCVAEKRPGEANVFVLERKEIVGRARSHCELGREEQRE